jgi:hypothetical protein
MAGVIASVTTAEVALVAATAKTVLGLKCAANHKIKLTAWGIYFDGTSVTEAPVVVELHRDTNTSAHTGTDLTEVEYDADNSTTLQVTAKHTVTANTTDGGTLQAIECHPQAGYEKAYIPGREPIFGGSAVGGCYWVVTAPSACNCIMWAEWEE